MAVIEGGMKCIKYLLFAFNLIFAVSFKKNFIAATHNEFWSHLIISLCALYPEEMHLFSLVTPMKLAKFIFEML